MLLHVNNWHTDNIPLAPISEHFDRLSDRRCAAKPNGLKQNDLATRHTGYKPARADSHIRQWGNEIIVSLKHPNQFARALVVLFCNQFDSLGGDYLLFAGFACNLQHCFGYCFGLNHFVTSRN